MKIIVSDSAAAVAKAAAHITRVLTEKPEAVLALAAGRTMEPLFKELVCLYEAGELSLRKARIFAVTEFEDVRPERSCHRAIQENLTEKTDFLSENGCFLGLDKLDTYDNMIKCAGGIDLAVLGIGANGHIGFNEPATPYDTYTHRQKLTDATKRQYAPAFGGAELVPDYGLTMGIKTLTQARDAILLALGQEKATAVFRTVYGKTESYTPASFLQLPTEVTLYLDNEAAEQL